MNKCFVYFLIFKHALGENHLDTAVSYDNLAGVYVHQEKYGDAEELYKKSFAIRKSMLGENHLDIAVSYNNLALIYVIQAEYENALSYFLEAYRIIVFKLGLWHPYAQTVCKSMELIYFGCNVKGCFEQWLEDKMKGPENN